MTRLMPLGWVLAIAVISVSAQESKKDNLSKKPPFERMLKGDDAKKRRS